MKKIIIMCSLILSSLAFAEQSDNPYIYDDEASAEVLAEGDAPAGPGDPDPVPIDQYVPALLLIALAMIVVYKRRHSISE